MDKKTLDRFYENKIYKNRILKQFVGLIGAKIFTFE